MLVCVAENEHLRNEFILRIFTKQFALYNNYNACLLAPFYVNPIFDSILYLFDSDYFYEMLSVVNYQYCGFIVLCIFVSGH